MTKQAHEWVRLGHGNWICLNCHLTDEEAKVVGQFDSCAESHTYTRGQNWGKTVRSGRAAMKEIYKW